MDFMHSDREAVKSLTEHISKVKPRAKAHDISSVGLEDVHRMAKKMPPQFEKSKADKSADVKGKKNLKKLGKKK